MRTDEQDSTGKLKIVFITGTILKVERSDVLRWLAEPANSLFVGFVSSVFLIYFAYIGRQEYLPQEIWQVAVSVLFFVVFFFFLVLAAVFLAFYIRRFQQGFILPMSLVIVMAHVLNQIVSVFLLERWDVYVPDSAVLYLRVIKLYVLVLGLEIFYSTYVLPRSALYKKRLFVNPAEWQPENKTPDPVPSSSAEKKGISQTRENPESDLKLKVLSGEHVSLGGHEFDPQKVRLIRAEQNYVEIETATNKVLVRATMKDAVDLMCNSLGVQAHRSCWVSFALISKTKTISNGKLLLELDDGETVIVPRARRKEVKQAIEQHAQSIASKVEMPYGTSGVNG